MPNPANANHKILLIEDDEQLQQSYQKLFSAEGFQVYQGYTGDQGIQLAKQERPDIILLDIMLKGGVNGFDVLERLKKDRDLFNIPVLMLTNLDSERKLALSIGAVDYLVKANTSIDLLLEKVKNYIGQSLTTFAEDTSQFGEASQVAAAPTAPMTTQVVPAPTTPVAAAPSVTANPTPVIVPTPVPSTPATSTVVPPGVPPADATSHGPAGSATQTAPVAAPPVTPLPASQPPAAPSQLATAAPMATPPESQPSTPTPTPQPLPDKSPLTL